MWFGHGPLCCAAPPPPCLLVSSQAFFKMQFNVILSENPSLPYRQNHLTPWQGDQSTVRLIIPVYQLPSITALCVYHHNGSGFPEVDFLPEGEGPMSYSSFILHTQHSLWVDWVPLMCGSHQGSEDSTGLGIQDGFFTHLLGDSTGMAERTGAWLGRPLHVASV